MISMSRREFLKYGITGAGMVFLSPFDKWLSRVAAEGFPEGENLGRVSAGKISLWTKPSANSTAISPLYLDTVLVTLREVMGEAPGYALSRRWFETPDGYIYAPSVQPVKNKPNQPVTSLSESSMGKGMWVEVTVPYVDLILMNPPARSPWMGGTDTPRLYYTQVIWVDAIRTTPEGAVQYRINEKFGTYGDIFWAAAEAFRPITKDEIAPINPGAADKKIVVDTGHQTLSCFEGNNEVYFCRISSGQKYDIDGTAVDKWATPVGSHYIWRKLFSIHMTGGTVSSGYDLPGIAWTCLFVGEGVAIHSTFWHNDYGTPRSHGCVNASPEDAKWIFRWTEPSVVYDPGDITIEKMFASTNVVVIEG
jgi:lipoprotein-anchoring transpeptidase ErfK/SrfK